MEDWVEIYVYVYYIHMDIYRRVGDVARSSPLATPAPTTLLTLAEILTDFLFFPLE